MSAKVAGPGDAPRIDAFLRRNASASAYHDYRWTAVVERSFGHGCHYLVAEERDGAICGALPLVHLKSRFFGNFLVSMPYFNYGGVCASDPAVRDALIDESIRTAERVGARHIEYRQESPLGNGFPAKTRKVSMRLTLPGSAEELWKAFPSKLRSQVRRPQKEGMEVRVGQQDELENFYTVFSINMRDLGTPVYPKRFFRNILDLFPESAWICTVSRGGTPLASGFLVGFRDRLELPWASSIRRYNRLGPNMLLYWSCLEFACRNGFRIFDFGRSTAGGNTHRFKEQWGAQPSSMYWHYWMADGGELPEIAPDNPKYRLAIGIWKRLPVPLTRLLGPRLVRNIP